MIPRSGCSEMYRREAEGLVEEMWSLSPTNSDVYDPYSQGEFKSADLSILSECLERLDNDTQKLRAELSHHANLVDALASNVDSVLGSELTESLSCLYRYMSKIEAEISVVVRQVDLERNERSVQHRMIVSLRATLTEAERQLEHATTFEKQLRAIEAAHRLDEQRLACASQKVTELTELVDIDRNQKNLHDNKPVVEWKTPGPCGFTDDTTFPYLRDSTQSDHLTISKTQEPVVTDEFSHPPYKCQAALTCDSGSKLNTGNPTKPLNFKVTNRIRTRRSLERLPRARERYLGNGDIIVRSRSVDLYPDSFCASSSAAKTNALFQSWFVQRIRREMSRRHQAEALLVQTQTELNRLKAIKNELYNNLQNGEAEVQQMTRLSDTVVICDKNEIDQQKIHTVQKYLFDSVHCAQLPVMDPNVCFATADRSANMNQQSYQKTSLQPKLSVHNHTVFDGEAFVDHDTRLKLTGTCGNTTDALPYTSNDLSNHTGHCVRRHFSEPDLLISCRSPYSAPQPTGAVHIHGKSSAVSRVANPFRSFSQSKQYVRMFSLASAKQRRFRAHALSSHKLSTHQTDRSNGLYRLVSFLRRSNDMLLRLTWLRKRSQFDRSQLYNCLLEYGEEFERFRSYVLQVHSPDEDSVGHQEYAGFPICLCHSIHFSTENDHLWSKINFSEAFVPARCRLSSSLEEIATANNSDFDGYLNTRVWQMVDPALLSSEDCFLQENLVENLIIQLNGANQKLRAQMEQCNELEALLAERDARLTAQANELAEVEANLAASTETVASLHQKLLTGNRNWTQLLQQIQAKSKTDQSLPNVDQLPALPAVLDLVRSLDAAYAELQESERCRVLSEQRAISALSTARRLRAQLRDTMSQSLEQGTFVADLTRFSTPSFLTDSSVQTERSPHTCRSSDAVNFVLCDVGVQHPGTDENNWSGMLDTEKKWKDEILRFGLSRPRNVLEHSQLRSDAEQVIELREALRNAIAQRDRLEKYRMTQRTRHEQLQQRCSQMNSELDATVDALRHHQTSNEIERRRSAVEVSQLRTQLARTNSLLNHYKMLHAKSMITQPSSSSSTDRSLTTYRASSASPVSVRPTAMENDRPDLLPSVNTDDLTLQLSMAQAELAQLRSNMTEQKAAADREATSLRGQLAEANADTRSLRLLVTRLQAAVNANGRNESIAGTNLEQLGCSNCHRLQRLLDLLQSKQCLAPSAAATTTEVSSEKLDISPTEPTGCDFGCQVSLGVSPKEPVQQVSADSTDVPSAIRLERWQKELTEFEQALQHKELELQKENGRLCFEADRLKRRQEALLAGETNLKKDAELHQAQIESQRVELQNDMLELSREKGRLLEERQTIDSERVRLHRLELELKQKRQEAEMLLEISTRQNQASREDEKVSLPSMFSEANLPSENASAFLTEPGLVEHQHASVFSAQYSLSSPGNPFQAQNFVDQPRFPDNPTDAVPHLFDWFERSLNQLGLKLLGILKDQLSAAERNMVSQLLASLKADVRKLRPQWMMESRNILLKANLAEATQLTPLPDTSQYNAMAVADVTQEQLWRKLRAAETEAKEATDQLKASNAEFLTLRERLSHATVERAHLKATVESLDEQVSQLESCLYERTQQLNTCRAELARYMQRVSIPIPTKWLNLARESGAPAKGSNSSLELQCAIPEATIVTLAPVSDHYSQLTSELRNCRVLWYRRFACVRHLIWQYCVRLQPLLQHISAMRSRLRIQSQPRPSVLFVFLLYFFLVHFLLLRCWLL